MNTADALLRALESSNICGRNLEAANVVDVINDLANATRSIARAITPMDAAAGRDACDGRVESLTEAVMGLTGGMVSIANAIGIRDVVIE